MDRSDKAEVLEAERNLRKSYNIIVPFPEPRPQSEVKYTLAYKEPASINVVGSYALKTALKTEGVLSIDMAITMPLVCRVILSDSQSLTLSAESIPR